MNRGVLWGMAEVQKSVQEILDGMTEEHRQMVAEGIAIMHRFSPEPAFKHGRPQYKNAFTVESIAHAKAKRER
jgi:hypothetical protein